MSTARAQRSNSLFYRLTASMYFDSHTHVNFAAYRDDAQDVLTASLKDDTWLVNVGTQKDTSKYSVELASRFEKGVYASIGLHPIHLTGDVDEEIIVNGRKEMLRMRQEVFDEKWYEELARSPKVVAIGEVGLDYSLRTAEEIAHIAPIQYDNLLRHLFFAQKHHLPLIIHCRDAHQDLQKIIREYSSIFREIGAVIHCFTATAQDAAFYWERGLLLSFTGIVTFSHDWDDLLKSADLTKIMIETDAPYLTPVPHRGKRNEPRFVRHVAKHIADLRGLDQEEIGRVTFENAIRFFRIRDSV